MKKELIVSKDDTLLNYLFDCDLPYSKSKLKSLLKHQCIYVNKEKTTQFDEAIFVGDVIQIIEHNKDLDTTLTVLYEDESILVIDKPYGLLTIATDKKEPLTAYRMASDYVKKQHPRNRIFVIHRIDMDTSGVLMFAKKKEVQEAYQKDWNDQVLERVYVAIVEGVVEKDSDTIESFLRENKTTHMYSTTTGQKAITHYRVVRRSKEYSLLSVNIDTGRKNQIRVHMHDIGHPIIGDRKYNATQNPLKRLGLHAYRLKLINPKTKKTMTFVAPLPNKFKRLVRISEAQEKAL